MERYAHQLQTHAGRLYLTGVHPHVLEQLELTETTDTISTDAIFLAEDTLGKSTQEAFLAARTWLDGETEQTRQT